MNLHDKPSVTGSIEYRVFKNGVLIEKCEQHNLVVNQGRRLLAQLISGAFINGGYTYVKYLQVGSGTAPADLTDTRLSSPTAYVAVSDHYVSGDANAVFEWKLTTEQANGISITEFALCDNNYDIVTHQVRGKVIEKEHDIVIEGTYTLHF